LRVFRQLLQFIPLSEKINSVSVSAVYIHRMHTNLTNYWTENLGCIYQMTEQGARTHVLCRYVTCTLNVNRILRIQTFLCRQLSILGIQLKNSIIRFMKIRFPIPGIHNNVFLYDFALQTTLINRNNKTNTYHIDYTAMLYYYSMVMYI